MGLGEDSPDPGGRALASQDPVDESALCVVQAARGNGTGFAFLRPNWIVTAKHVVAGQPPSEPLRLLFRQGVSLPARVLFAHPRVDLAVLEVFGDTGCRAPLWPGDAEPAAGLLCVGYKPSVSDKEAGRYTSFVSRVDSYERSNRHRDGYEETLYIFPASDGEPGHSGGPLLAPSGAVIGVVVDGITLAGQHLMRATCISVLLDHLVFTTAPELM